MSKQTTSVSAFFIKLRMWIQIGCLVVLNSDFAAFFRGVMKRKASISKATTKQFCVPGLNCYSCPSAIGACPIGALQFWLNDTANKIKMGQEVNLSGLYILGMMGTVGALAGRLPCGWICPFGLVQDWLGRITKSNRKIAGICGAYRVCHHPAVSGDRRADTQSVVLQIALSVGNAIRRIATLGDGREFTKYGRSFYHYKGHIPCFRHCDEHVL